jgi:hypothetical protein
VGTRVHPLKRGGLGHLGVRRANTRPIEGEIFEGRGVMLEVLDSRARCLVPVKFFHS